MIGLINEGITALPGLDLQTLFEDLSQFFFASLRIGSFLIASPFFGSKMVILPVRILTAVVLTITVVSLNPYLPEVEVISSVHGITIAASEIAIGISAGLVLSILFAGASLAGEKIASSSGLAMATAADPISGSSSPVMAQILTLFLLITFMSFDGHLAAFRTIIESYHFIPIGTFPNGEGILKSGISSAGIMFKVAAIIMLPIAIILLLVNVAIGVITRSAPTLNIFSFAFPVTMMAVFFLVYVTLSLIGVSLATLAGDAVIYMQNTLENMKNG